MSKQPELMDVSEVDGAAPNQPEPEVIDRPPQELARPEPERRSTELAAGKIQLSDSSQVAQLAQFVSQSGMKIGGANTPADITLALMAGLEAGLTATQTIKNIMVVNGRPAIWGDALLALVQRSDEFAGCDVEIRGKGDDRVAVCTCKRIKRAWNDTAVPMEIKRTFSVADAKAARLWGKSGPWSNYPERMLGHRARTFALRDLWADHIGGLNVTEEVQDYTVTDRAAFDPGDTKAARLAEKLNGGDDAASD